MGIAITRNLIEKIGHNKVYNTNIIDILFLLQRDSYNYDDTIIDTYISITERILTSLTKIIVTIRYNYRNL